MTGPSTSATPSPAASPASATSGVRTVLHPVSDLDKAKAVYTALLGVPPRNDSPYYVGYEAAGQHIGLVPGGGPQALASPVAYWHVKDVGATVSAAVAAGATVTESPHEVGGGRLVATVADPDGNVLGIIQDGPAAARTRADRRADTEHRLARDVDVWVATASGDGAPYLVPLSFDWDGRILRVATPANSPTGRNLAASGTARLALGPTRDVVVIDGTVEVLAVDALPQEPGDRFAARTGFDPRTLTTAYRWFHITPRRIQAWREENELSDRDLMRDGHWLA
jgi:predicted enzyme related to lactoylglutathione lyase